jgi:hypothetical protein
LDISIQSEYQRSESLINLRAIKHQERFSIYGLDYKKSKNLQNRSKQQRRHSERLSGNRKNPSVTQNYCGERLHYITYKYDKNKPKSIFIYKPIPCSSSTTTTTSKFTHTTASESSSFIDQNKFVKPIRNSKEKSNCFF